jgi:hypothetical protein
MINKETLKTILLALAIVAVLIFVTNQAISLYPKLKILSDNPCQVCREIEPRVEGCFYELEHPTYNTSIPGIENFNFSMP